jgi:hypothetical protein
MLMRRRFGLGAGAQPGGPSAAGPQQDSQTSAALAAPWGADRFGGQGFAGRLARGFGAQQGRFRADEPAQGNIGAAMRGFEDQIIDSSAGEES